MDGRLAGLLHVADLLAGNGRDVHGRRDVSPIVGRCPVNQDPRDMPWTITKDRVATKISYVASRRKHSGTPGRSSPIRSSITWPAGSGPGSPVSCTTWSPTTFP